MPGYWVTVTVRKPRAKRGQGSGGNSKAKRETKAIRPRDVRSFEICIEYIKKRHLIDYLDTSDASLSMAQIHLLTYPLDS